MNRLVSQNTRLMLHSLPTLTQAPHVLVRVLTRPDLLSQAKQTKNRVCPFHLLGFQGVLRGVPVQQVTVLGGDILPAGKGLTALSRAVVCIGVTEEPPFAVLGFI